MTTEIFQAVIRRIYEATETNTPKQLAEILNVTASSVSRMFRKQNVPHEQLFKLWEATGISPRWLLTGSGCKFLVHSDFRENTPLDMLADQIRKQEAVRAEAFAMARKDMSGLLELFKNRVPVQYRSDK